MGERLSDYAKVREFHVKFGVPTDEDGDPPHMPEQHVVDFRAGFMQEELNEYKSSCEVGDLAGAMDALIDLAYVVYGTALMHGVSPQLWQELFDDVQAANMRKERAVNKDDPRSKRKHSFDIVKPAGWIGPDGASILRKYGAKVD